MKVLFAVDGSSGCFDAVAQVGQLLNAEHDELAFYLRTARHFVIGHYGQ